MKSARSRKPRTPKPPVIPESEVQKSAIAILRGLGWQVFRRNVGGRKWTDRRGRERYMAFAEPGQSDLWGLAPALVYSSTAPLVWHATHVEIEIKRLGEWPTEDQIRWMMAMNRAGAVAFWVDDTEKLMRVARHVMAGGKVEMFATGQYRLIGGTKS